MIINHRGFTHFKIEACHSILLNAFVSWKTKESAWEGIGDVEMGSES
jgi:hypothetical protein